MKKYIIVVALMMKIQSGVYILLRRTDLEGMIVLIKSKKNLIKKKRKKQKNIRHIQKNVKKLEEIGQKKKKEKKLSIEKN